MKNYQLIITALAAAGMMNQSCTGTKSDSAQSDTVAAVTQEVPEVDTIIVADEDTQLIDTDADTQHSAKPLPPVTQFMLVEILDFDGEDYVSLRANEDVMRRMTTLGFKTVAKGNPSKAVRSGASGGVTTVESYKAPFDNELDQIRMNFADETELAGFIESLGRSGWKKSGNNYVHPLSESGECVVRATVKGTSVVVEQNME